MGHIVKKKSHFQFYKVFFEHHGRSSALQFREKRVFCTREIAHQGKQNTVKTLYSTNGLYKVPGLNEFICYFHLRIGRAIFFKIVLSTINW